MKIHYLIIFMLLNIPAVHADFLVIGHPDINKSLIKISELADIYMKKHSTLANGTPIIPVNRSANSALRRQFESKVIKMSTREIKTYWLKLRFKGIRPPVVISSSEAAILFVKRVAGAITYIDTSQTPNGVKILMKIKHK